MIWDVPVHAEHNIFKAISMDARFVDHKNKVWAGAIIGDGDRQSWNPRAPVVWDNFSIFRTNCVILTSYVRATPSASLGNTRAKRAHAQGLYFQNSGCECELHSKNSFFELKSNFISIQNFKAGNVKPPGMHWSKDF